MEKRDIELIEKYSMNDKVLAELYREHLDFEKKIGELEHKHFLTADEEFKIRDLKKKKLMGRDRIESLLRKYRAAEKKA